MFVEYDLQQGVISSLSNRKILKIYQLDKGFIFQIKEFSNK